VRIVVAGALANKPGYGGEVWVRLAWVRGLQALGARVLFVEELDVGEQDSASGPSDTHQGVRFFQEVCDAFGLRDSAALITADGRHVSGLPMGAVSDFAADAEVLVNISGHLTNPAIFTAVRRRAYVDLDPGFTHFWHAAGIADLRLDAHDVHFTVGTNVGTARCDLPTSGIRWIPVLQPVLLDEWPVEDPVEELRFTTVASWRGAYGPLSHGGRSYGLKVHEFRKLADLPRRVPFPFEIALDLHPADERDRRLMESRGWTLVDPRLMAGTPQRFRAYVANSGAEFSVAQGIYVETASGWFSDRSARYLAAGRPVVVQDTGFGHTLPTGEGILTYRTMRDAEAAVRSVSLDRPRHARAARQIAEAYFDARKVLAAFLDRALPRRRPRGVAAPAPRVSTSSVLTADGRRTVLVSGMVARVPGQGGATWAVLQYVLGLLRLGHDVLLVEEVEPGDLLPVGAPLEQSRNAAYFRRVARRFGLEDRASLVLRGTRRTVGLPWAEVRRRLGPRGVLLNLSGTLRDETLRRQAAVRVYVDLDPTFTQLWHEAEGLDVGLDGHTHFVTVGLRLGSPGCAVPSCGRSWIRSLPPVVLDLWAPGAPLRREALTTVANWRGYGSVRWNGIVYGQKVHAFREIFDLPTRVREARFDVALAIHENERDDRAALRSHRWRVLDPRRVAGTPDRYMRFVRESAAELGVAKAGYVRSECGWFSDRSVCYLASGRPVLAQDTGFPAELPTGQGLLAFRSAEEAAEGVRDIRSNYARHTRAARQLAEEHFDSRRVLGRLMEEVTW
jgi:hypothetical protein